VDAGTATVRVGVLVTDTPGVALAAGHSRALQPLSTFCSARIHSAIETTPFSSQSHAGQTLKGRLPNAMPRQSANSLLATVPLPLQSPVQYAPARLGPTMSVAAPMMQIVRARPHRTRLFAFITSLSLFSLLARTRSGQGVRSRRR
jgi:hypothetical protein